MPPVQINIPPAAIGKTLAANQYPDNCPICHTKILPLPLQMESGGKRYKAEMVVLYKCPNLECEELFIGYFVRPGDVNNPNRPGNIFNLVGTRPIEPIPLTFSDPIKEISQNFCDIYEEAHKAEEFGLTQICGVGYRKALEFLIKDYVIKNRPAEQATIEAIMLGPCIENYATDPRIKEVAKRATWLGNDETHYQRRWIDKDLNDLKTMIGLVRHWIEAEHLTEEALKSMPAPVKP